MNSLRGEARPQWHQMTALFGGRFDPPHLGHREAVRGLFQDPGVKEVLIIPSAAPPHKPSFASAQDRFQMASLCFESTAEDPYPAEVKLSPIELIRAQRDPSRPSYSFDTLQELKAMTPHLAFTIGTDQLHDLPNWHRFPEILSQCCWIVLNRKGSLKDPRLTLREWEASGLIHPTSSANLWKIQKNLENPRFLTIVDTPAPALSSSQIRADLAKTGTPPAGSLLPSVLGYLKAHPIYGI